MTTSTLPTESTTAILSNKSMLAKLLAREDIVVTYNPAASTALFNSVTRTLTLPVWNGMSNDLHEMLVAHEVGHALHTPASEQELLDAMRSIDENMSSIAKSYLNVVEDVRIEQRIKAEFPGSRRNFAKGYKELLDRNFFQLGETSMKNRTLCDRINLHAKIGFLVEIPFSDYEKEILNAVTNARSWNEVVEAAKAIWEYDGTQSKKDSNDSGNSNEFGDSNDSQNGENGPNMDSESDSSQEDGQQDSADAGANADGESGTESPTGEDGNNTESGKSSDSDNTDSDEDSENESNSGEGDVAPAPTRQNPDSHREDVSIPSAPKSVESVEKALKEMTAGSTNDKVVNGVLPTPNLDRMIQPWTRIAADMNEIYNENPNMRDMVDKATSLLRAENTRNVNIMVREFERRRSAATHRRNRTGTRGVLDVNRLHAYKFSEDLFKSYTITKDGKSHGIVMFVDWSGSMNSVLGDTVNQMLSMALFCQKAKIPFEVYAFSTAFPAAFNGTSKPSTWNSAENEVWSSNVGDYNCVNLVLLNLLSSEMNKKQFDEAIRNMLVLCMVTGSPNIHLQKACMDLKMETPYIYCPKHSHYGLGGTPLNSAIVAAMDIVPAFRRKHSTQILSTIFLTDGGASDNIGTSVVSHHNVDEDGNSLPVATHVGWGNLSWIRHRSQRVSYKSTQIHGRNSTDFLLNILRDVTSSRILNFSVVIGCWDKWSRAIRRSSSRIRPPYDVRHLFEEKFCKENNMDRFEFNRNIDTAYLDKLAAWVEESAKNGVGIVSNVQGFDEIYIITSDSMKKNDDDFDDLDSNASITKIRNAFLKNQNKTSKSRVFLNRVAEQVATSL